jgi:glycosyltransferase involved in cell wall biosynthesis
MVIGIYIESYETGGVDSVILNKIKYWPKNDKFIIFYNKEYREINKILKPELKDKVKFIKLNILTIESICHRFKLNNIKIFIRLLGMMAKYFFFIINFLNAIKILNENKIENLFIHNGGYPGGLSTIPFALAFYLKKKKKSKYIIHSLPLKISYLNFFYEYLSDKLLSNFTELIFVSKFSSALMFSRRFLNCKHKIIFNGSRIPDFKIKIKKNSITTFIYVGRINKEKGILFILKNFEELLKNKIDKFNIILCGKISNEVLIQMKYFLKNSLLKNKIKYYGFIKNKFVQKKISNADYLILPSIQIENLSMSVIESFSVGVPVIASNVGAIKEICGKNNANILFNPESNNDFRKKIIKIINEDIKKRVYKKKIINNIFLKKFTALEMSKKYSLLMN